MKRKTVRTRSRGAKKGTGRGPLARARERDLERIARGGAKGKIKVEDYEEVSEESSSILSFVKDLERQLDAAYALKEAVETDLAAAQETLGEESAARAELEAQVKSLKERAALVDQLREDISFVEQERDAALRRLTEATTQLEQSAKERGSLADRLDAAEKRINELQQYKMDMDLQAGNLKDELAMAERLREEVADLTDARLALEEEVGDLRNRLEASETSKSALELNLTSNREIIRGLREEVENLRKELAAVNIDLTDVRAQLGEQMARSRNLAEANRTLEREAKMLASKHESTVKELEAAKQALRDIRTATAHTTGRARRRYYQPGGKG